MTFFFLNVVVIMVMRIPVNNNTIHREKRTGRAFHTASPFGSNGSGIAQFVHLGDIHADRSGGSGAVVGGGK